MKHTKAEVLDLLRQAAEQVKRQHLGHLELFLVREKAISIEVFNQNIDTFQFSQTQGIGLRLINSGRCGYSFTEKLDKLSLEEAIKQAKANAAILEPDHDCSLAKSDYHYPEVELVNEQITSLPISEKIDMALQLEKRARSYDSKIVNVPSSSYSEKSREILIINSLGLEASYVTNGAGLAIDVMAQQEGETKSAYKIKTSRFLEELNCFELADAAAKEGVDLLGAKNISTGHYPIVFTPTTGRQILGAFWPMFSAKNVQEAKSLLAGKLMQQIAVPAVSLTDHPLLNKGLASRPFDDEGTPSLITPVIKEGILQTYLHNCTTARKDRLQSTAHARRASVKGPLEIAPTNLILSSTDPLGSPQYMLKKVDEGIVVVNLHGLHSGTSAISGDFSLGAQGFYFHGGEVQYPVHNFTIAGNFLELLRNIVVIGDDLELGPTAVGGTSICTPSFLVSSLSISGTS